MVEMNDDERNEVLEMDKIIEKLLMPPPSMTPKTFVRTSVESLRDASGSSLDRSNDSSGGTNNSWLSDSSCGCHSISPRTEANKKSAFVFHKQSLLPPLLCSASRTEMQIYRTRAVEREEKRKLRSKQRLISRVEAILSSVDMRKKGVNDNNSEIDSSGEKLPGHLPNEEEKMRSEEEKSTGDGSDDLDNRRQDGFHDSAYRSSLRNLLQKSLVLNRTNAVETSEVKEASTSSESETDVTENTVVESQEKTAIRKQPEALRNTGSEYDTEYINEEEKAVDYLVENVIMEAKTRIMNETKEDDNVEDEQEMEHKYSDMKQQSIQTQDQSLWKTPVIIKGGKDMEEISPLGVVIVHGNDLHNQSTSTKVNFIPDEDAMMKEGNLAEQSPITLSETTRRIDKSLDVTELKGSLCYDSTIADSCSVPMGTNSPESTMVTLATDSTIGDMTFLRPITSATASDITITNVSQKSEETLESCPKFENEFCKDLTMETGSLVTLKRSSSFTLDCPSTSFESAVIQAVSRHFHGIRTQENLEQTKQDNDAKLKHELPAVDMKKKMMLSARVRRGSYTLEEPSPYLIKNKNDHMISDDCSETTDGSVIDVKRRLDLPSDSEESSVAMSSKKSINNVSKKEEQEPAVTDIYRLLNTEHQQQMEILKKQHEKQIQNLQQELIRDKVMPMPKKCGNFKSYSLDYTVSPSRASTEYHDINLHGRQYEEDEEDEDVSTHVDVSRITETEITSTLHQKLCKFSALCKGYLTRRLLRTSKVQDIMKIIRDTSRLILSLRTEPKQSIDGIISVGDTMFEDQLITQLRSAMYQLHDIFFTISRSEQMYVIAMSRDESCLKKSTKQCQLSMATKKSLERKRLLSSSTEPPSRPNSNIGKAYHPKEVKSKISHIWKSPEQKYSASNHNQKVTSQKPIVTSQKPAPTTSQNSKGNSSNVAAKQVLQRPKVKPSKSKVTSQESKMTSSNAKMTSQNVRKRAVKKSMPLSNKINHGNQSISKA